MKETFKTVGKLCVLFIFMITTFFLLMIASYLLPKDEIRKNTYLAINNFNTEGTWYRPFFTTNVDMSFSMMLDNYTDTLIMDVVAVDANSDETNIFRKAVLNQKYRDGEDPVKSYEEVFSEMKKPNGSYARYWFGTIVILKLLLLFMNYSTIRYINMIFIFTLLFITVLLIERKLNFRYAIAYAISIVLCGIMIIPMSLQFSPVFIITLLFSIAILMLSNKENFEKLLLYIFLMIGCLTAFCDLLTCPLLTFGIPIILVMLLRNKSEKYTFKQNLFFYFKLAIIWIASYSLTYLSKWIIASIILKKNVVAQAWKQFMFRTDSANKYNKIDTIYSNFKLYFNKIVLVLLAIFMIVNFIIIVKKKCYKNVNLKNIVYLIAVGLAPYVWYIVLSNHSSIHSWMTYRIQAITMMAVLSAVFSFYDKKTSTISSQN